MKNALLSLSLLGLLGLTSAATAADLAGRVVAPPPPAPELLAFGRVPPVIAQIGPTTPYSTIDCTEFTKLPDGAWKAIGNRPFGLGFVQGIVPPLRPILVGGFIYNNIDLYSQLELQCVSTLVRARY